MRYLISLAVVVVTAFALLSDAQEGSHDAKFQALVDEYLEFSWKQSPLSATFAGVHKYDDQIESFAWKAANERLQQSKVFAERFGKEIDRAKLSESNQIDFDLIQRAVQAQEFGLLRDRSLQNEPSIYPQAIAGTGFIMFTRDYAPEETRFETLAARMEKMPAILQAGKENLKNPPKLWITIAIETTKGAIGLYEQLISPAAGRLKDEALRARVQKASAELVSALQDYQQFLEKDLMPKSTGSYADGREHFVSRLKNFYLIDRAPEQIKSQAEKVMAETKAQMESIARKLDPTKSWWEVLEDAKKKHFTADEVLPVYRKVTQRSRQWVIEKKIATVPEETLQVIETPQFMRFVVPYAAYFAPAPFEEKQEGFYFVTPVDPNMTAEQKEGKLGELYIDIENTTVHEAYPGHHLQLIHQNRLSKVRRLADSSLMSEGWGLYCERLGEEFGFYSSPIDSLQAYRWLIVRAVRVILDVGLHTEGMTYEQGVDFMVEHAKLERPAAEAEVRRYTQTPTQPLSYLMGMLLIEELREDYRKEKGDQFSLQEFHDAVLSYGSIPLKTIRESMMKPQRRESTE